MYGRDYDGKTLNFEASGGLTNASLVMQDKQTNTYWSLMKGEASTGELKGQSLNELPIGEKTTWEAWHKKHPNTKVLSINSRQDGQNPYQAYFEDEKGHRGLKAKDDRLSTKSPIFAFRREKKTAAVPYSAFQSGAVFPLADGCQLFLYRQRDDRIFQSTAAFVSKSGFSKQEGKWTEVQSGSSFDETSRSFGENVERLSGFDTFWYNWSLNNPDTELLETKATHTDR